ncbi:hypothetical protein Q8F55_001695 [Vanrija albida]|uniref:Uncharacterized protein n=1 Tax=Vanrija albida TaxID=181172 RepID=A0ABR3Q7N8_9TREE
MPWPVSARHTAGYTVWLAPDEEQEKVVTGILKDYSDKTFVNYKRGVERRPKGGFAPMPFGLPTPSNEVFSDPPPLPPSAILILPPALCGHTSADSIKTMAKEKVDAYTGGPINIKFGALKSTSGAWVWTPIDEGQSDSKKIDTLRTALKDRLWSTTEKSHLSVPTPYLVLLDLNPGLEAAMDPAFRYIEHENDVRVAFDGKLPSLTLTKVVVMQGNKKIGEFPIPKAA